MFSFLAFLLINLNFVLPARIILNGEVKEIDEASTKISPIKSKVYHFEPFNLKITTVDRITKEVLTNAINSVAKISKKDLQSALDNVYTRTIQSFQTFVIDVEGDFKIFKGAALLFTRKQILKMWAAQIKFTTIYGYYLLFNGLLIPGSSQNLDDYYTTWLSIHKEGLKANLPSSYSEESINKRVKASIEEYWAETNYPFLSAVIAKTN